MRAVRQYVISCTSAAILLDSIRLEELLFELVQDEDFSAFCNFLMFFGPRLSLDLIALLSAIELVF